MPGPETSLPTHPPGGCLGNVTKPALSHTLRAPLPKSQLHAYSIRRVTKSTLLIALRARVLSKSQRPSINYKSGSSQPLERMKPLLISILNSHPLHTFVSHPHAHILTHSTHPSLALPAYPHTLSPITPSFPFNHLWPPPRTSSSILWLPFYTASTPLNTIGKYCFSIPLLTVSIKSTYLLSQDTHFFLRLCFTQGLSNQTSIFLN